MSYMIDETRIRIIQIFKEHSCYAKTQDIRSSGIHHKYLQQLVEIGSIIKLKHGLYSLTEIDNYTVLQEALLTVPDGIVCMGKALSFYELTIGHTEVKTESGNIIASYDKERIVYDAVRFRNRIGMDIIEEVLL